MSQQMFVNAMVKDLEKSKSFFEALGYFINPQFTNEDGACVVIDEGHNYVMLLTETHFKKFTHKEIVDAQIANETLIALSLESREEVDVMHNKAVGAGGKLHRAEDLGFMYTKAMEDLDGHIWEFFYMDLSKMPTAE